MYIGKIILIYVRYLSIPFTVMFVGGIVLAMLIAAFQIKWLEPVFFVLLWSGAIGCVGLFSSVIVANFIKCRNCGKQALVYPDPDPSESGNITAIYQTKACHNCGSKLSI